MRLGCNNFERELGPSKNHFHPTRDAKLFTATSSIKKANTLLAKKATQISNHDRFSQIRQIRSYFIIANIYCFSR